MNRTRASRWFGRRSAAVDWCPGGEAARFRRSWACLCFGWARLANAAESEVRTAKSRGNRAPFVGDGGGERQTIRRAAERVPGFVARGRRIDDRRKVANRVGARCAQLIDKLRGIS